jgi:hypothetical protein
MRYFILLLVLIKLYSLEPMQIKNLVYIFNKAKPYNLSYTMSAIAMQESDLGRYFITINKDGSMDCSMFMINTKTLSKNQWKQSRLCERLIRDKDFSISIAIERFKYFYNYWFSKGYSEGVSWRYAVMSYHCGFNIRHKRCIDYYKKIIKNIKFIRKEFK